MLDFLYEIPGPTSEWAEIIGHLAWPLTVIFLLLWFRREVSEALAIITGRLREDDLHWGDGRMVRNADFVTLDRDFVTDSTNDYAEDDIVNVELLFELIAEEEGMVRLGSWITEHMAPVPEIDNFITQPIYATERQQAVTQLLQEG